MRLTTIRIDGGTTAARIEGDDLVRLPYPDLVALLGRPFSAGDLIATGTPGGVGAGRDPQVFLRAGQTVTTTIEGIGSCINQVVAEV